MRLSAEDGGIIGDADDNGRVNLNDVSLMLKYVAKWNVEIDEDAADTDGDGRVNISDVSYVLKKVAGWF